MAEQKLTREQAQAELISTLALMAETTERMGTMKSRIDFLRGYVSAMGAAPPAEPAAAKPAGKPATEKGAPA